METRASGGTRIGPVQSATRAGPRASGASASAPRVSAEAVAPASSAADTHNEEAQHDPLRWSMSAAARNVLLRTMEQRPARGPRRDKIMASLRAYGHALEDENAAPLAGDGHMDLET